LVDCGTYVDRQQAIDLLRELAVNDLAEPSYVHVSERKPNHYQLKIKANYDITQINEFAKKRSLAIEENADEKTLIIFKP
jgi:hypothetical protein